ILSSPPAALIFCRIPVGMSSDVQPQRLRSHRRRTCRGSQRVHPYRMANFNSLPTPLSQCNRQNFNQESVSRVRTQEGSSFRVTTKSGGPQNAGYLLENQQEAENDIPLPNDAERDHSVPTDSAHHSYSLETLSPPRLQIRPSYNQSSFPVSQIENNSDTANEFLIESEPESPLSPLISADSTCKESFELKIKQIGLYQRQNSSTPLLNFEEAISSPQQRIVPDMFPTPTADAQRLANSLIKLSRFLKTPNITELHCLDCRYVPYLPVTGQCGHTRCMRCIVSNGACPCSADAPESLLVNTVVQEIIEKMMRYIKKPRIIESGSTIRAPGDKTSLLFGVTYEVSSCIWRTGCSVEDVYHRHRHHRLLLSPSPAGW
ncbi:jg25954, partial [Pararge aegeria aegeria]